MLNAYILTFGGLLLLGARAGDLLGRRLAFLTGIALFTLSSLVGGLAVTGWMLLAARAVQGIGAALAAPSALSLLTATFAEGPARVRAIAPLHHGVGGRWRHRARRRRAPDRARLVALGDVRERAHRDRRVAAWDGW